LPEPPSAYVEVFAGFIAGSRRRQSQVQVREKKKIREVLFKPIQGFICSKMGVSAATAMVQGCSAIHFPNNFPYF